MWLKGAVLRRVFERALAESIPANLADALFGGFYARFQDQSSACCRILGVGAWQGHHAGTQL